VFGIKKSRPKPTNNTARRSPALPPQHRVVSYYTASRRQLDNFRRSDISNPNKRASKHLAFVKKWWFWLIIVLAALVMAGYLLSLGTLPIVKIDGATYRPMAQYQEIIQKELGKSWRNHSKLTLKSDQLESALYQLLPEAQTIEITSSLIGHAPVAKIHTYSPMAVFAQAGQTNRIISDRGKLLLKTDQSPGVDASALPLLQNDTGVQAREGEQFLSPDDATAFMRLHNQYVTEGAVTIYALTVSPHELLVSESGRGYKVKYLLSDQIVIQFGALRATEKKLAEIGQVPASYIDVRLADKVYYQ
jgi:hypothetical protein